MAAPSALAIGNYPPQFPDEEVKEKYWLSNLEADPSEKRNLAGAEPERVRQMTGRIRAWERSVSSARRNRHQTP